MNASDRISPFFHGDYMSYHLHCAGVESARLEVGDVVWAPSADGFNPWREMVQITEVRGNGWYMACAMGATCYRFKAELRWFPMTTTFYMARNVHEVELAGGAK